MPIKKDSPFPPKLREGGGGKLKPEKTVFYLHREENFTSIC